MVRITARDSPATWKRGGKGRRPATMNFPFRSRPHRTMPERRHQWQLEIDGQTLPVTMKHHATARRFILRFNKTRDGLTVTLPPGADEREAFGFVKGQGAWISARLETRDPVVPFAHGALIPVRGDRHLIDHCPEQRGTAWVEDGADGPPRLCVAGDEAHLPRRVTDWLKREARAELRTRCACYADTMGLRYARVVLRDQSSRWGSCSSSGTLSFSWRLILAPIHVLDYVAAHEVAHLQEMNHSPRFWKLVDEAVPEMDRSRRWLKEHGPALHLYGPRG